MGTSSVNILVVQASEEESLLSEVLSSFAPSYSWTMVEDVGKGAKVLAQKAYDACVIESTALSHAFNWLRNIRSFGYRKPVIVVVPSEEGAEKLLQEGGVVKVLSSQELTPSLLENSLQHACEYHNAQTLLDETRAELEACVRDRAAELSKAHSVIEQAANRTASILDTIGDAFFTLDRQWHFTYANATAETYFQKTRGELLGSNIWSLFPRTVGSQLYAACYAAMESLLPKEAEEWDQEARKWLAIRVYPSSEGVSLFIADITARKDMEEQVRRQSLYDALTDLPNRAMFEARLTQTLHNADSHVAVLFLDFDRFKTINDTLGHAKGDVIIQQAAKRLKKLVKNGDMVARFGADEFLIMVNGSLGTEKLAKFAEKVHAILREPFRLGQRKIHINTSIGLSVFPEDGDTAEALIKNADTSLYRAKEVGGNTYRFYTHAMHFKASEDLTLENDLREAVERDEFTIYYQPIVETRTGRVARSEALLRWNHPQLGIIFPNEFIPLAEEIGVIVRLSEWVLAKICDQLAEWKEQGYPDMVVAFNVSPRHFAQPDFCRRIEAIVKEKGVESRQLQVEITESMAMHNIYASMAKLSSLKEMGIKISVDDFGTGHSSLSYLKQLPIDRIKIDKSFIKNIPGDQRDAAIVKAIVSMGATLGLQVCAEGVETDAQFDYLSSLDCEAIQGFLFSKSLPPEAFVEWVASNGRGDLQAETFSLQGLIAG